MKYINSHIPNFILRKLFLIYVYISALLLLYDVTNKISFDNIRAWLSEIRDYANDQVVIMLIGNFYLQL